MFVLIAVHYSGRKHELAKWFPFAKLFLLMNNNEHGRNVTLERNHTLIAPLFLIVTQRCEIMQRSPINFTE